MADIDRGLRERAKELLRTRERIARLPDGDLLFVPAEVADYLDRLRELGVSQRSVRMECDVWILLQSVSAKEAAIWLADKRDAMADPEFGALSLEYDAAFDRFPEDPRLGGGVAAADRVAEAPPGSCPGLAGSPASSESSPTGNVVSPQTPTPAQRPEQTLGGPDGPAVGSLFRSES